jgi:hypothetical protein
VVAGRSVLSVFGAENSITSQPLTGAEHMPNVALLIYLNLLQEKTLLSPDQVGAGRQPTQGLKTDRN